MLWLLLPDFSLQLRPTMVAHLLLSPPDATSCWARCGHRSRWHSRRRSRARLLICCVLCSYPAVVALLMFLCFFASFATVHRAIDFENCRIDGTLELDPCFDAQNREVIARLATPGCRALPIPARAARPPLRTILD